MSKDALIGWILVILAMAALIAAAAMSSGCGITRQALGYKSKAEKALEEQGFKGPKEPKKCPTCKRLIKPGIVKQVEYRIGSVLGLAAYLGGLAIAGGALILTFSIINKGKWKLGVAIFAAGVIAILGIYATAVILPWVRWIAIGVLIAILVVIVIGVIWILYQVFVLKRGFFEVVTCFQRKKDAGWNRETIDFMNRNQDPATRKLVREVKATLPPAEPPETLKLAQD